MNDLPQPNLQQLAEYIANMKAIDVTTTPNFKALLEIKNRLRNKRPPCRYDYEADPENPVDRYKDMLQFDANKLECENQRIKERLEVITDNLAKITISLHPSFFENKKLSDKILDDFTDILIAIFESMEKVGRNAGIDAMSDISLTYDGESFTNEEGVEQ